MKALLINSVISVVGGMLGQALLVWLWQIRPKPNVLTWRGFLAMGVIQGLITLGRLLQ